MVENYEYKAVLWIRHCQACHNLDPRVFGIPTSERKNSVCTKFGQEESLFWGQNFKNYLNDLYNNDFVSDLTGGADLTDNLKEDYFTKEGEQIIKPVSKASLWLKEVTENILKNNLKKVTLNSSLLPRAMETAQIISKGLLQSNLIDEDNKVNRLRFIEEKTDQLANQALFLYQASENIKICNDLEIQINNLNQEILQETSEEIIQSKRQLINEIAEKKAILCSNLAKTLPSNFRKSVISSITPDSQLTANFISPQKSNEIASLLNSILTINNGFLPLSSSFFPLNNSESLITSSDLLRKYSQNAIEKRIYDEKPETIELRIRYQRFLSELLNDNDILKSDTINLIVTHSAFLRTNLDFELNSKEFKDPSTFTKNLHKERKPIEKAMKMANLDAYLCIYKKPIIEGQPNQDWIEDRSERRLLLSRINIPSGKNIDLTQKNGYQNLESLLGKDVEIKASVLDQRSPDLIKNGGWLKYNNLVQKNISYLTPYSSQDPNNKVFRGIPRRIDSMDKKFKKQFDEEWKICNEKPSIDSPILNPALDDYLIPDLSIQDSESTLYTDDDFSESFDSLTQNPRDQWQGPPPSLEELESPITNPRDQWQGPPPSLEELNEIEKPPTTTGGKIRFSKKFKKKNNRFTKKK